MSNRFIICGASRSGKSALARRLQKKLEISWILGDAIVSGLEDAFHDLGISHQGDLSHIGDMLTNYIKFLLWHYDYAGCGYVFDSTHLYPRHVLNIREKIGAVPAVFLFYAEADPKQKLLEIRRFDPAQNWWTAELSDNELMQVIHDQINKSRELSESCADFDIPYIEVSQDFELALEKAERILGVGAVQR